MPRPSDYSEEIAEALCAELASGRSLRSICAEDESLPAERTVYMWLLRHEGFVQKYTRAREVQADVLVDEVLDIADTPVMGEKTKVTSDGKSETTTGDMIDHRRLRVDARKWMAAKLAPKKYGDKLELAGDPSNPVMVPVINVSVGGGS